MEQIKEDQKEIEGLKKGLMQKLGVIEAKVYQAEEQAVRIWRKSPLEKGPGLREVKEPAGENKESPGVGGSYFIDLTHLFASLINGLWTISL